MNDDMEYDTFMLFVLGNVQAFVIKIACMCALNFDFTLVLASQSKSN